MQKTNEGTVIRLKEQIEFENEAGKRALHGPTHEASHTANYCSMDGMWDNIEHLEQIAGEEVVKHFLMRL